MVSKRDLISFSKKKKKKRKKRERERFDLQKGEFKALMVKKPFFNGDEAWLESIEYFLNNR